MALKLLSSPIPHPCWWSSSYCVEGKSDCCRLSRWPVRRKNRSNYMVVRASSLEEAISVTAAVEGLSPRFPQHLLATTSPFLLGDTLDVGYSQASYYTSLGLFIISVPGLWSLIKRSVKSKIVKKTFTLKEGEGKSLVPPKELAGQIFSFFTRNNFLAVLDRGDTITFEGMMVPSRSQAALLTFCTCISLASIGLVLTITFPDIGNNWFYLTTLSPLAGIYYWTRASRKEQIQVKIMLGDDGSLSEIIVQGDDQQVDLMRRELQLTEKGMIYVKGMFER